MKKIVDGNTACSNIAYYFSEVSSIYPITPSSPMASNIDNLRNTTKTNIFGSVPELIEMQSEAGAAGALHGSLLSGSLSTTFTASQGLLLMLPNMYKIAGEMLPGVIHVAARSIATHALSIFGDHQDIYATRQTGFCILASSNVFDAQNLAAVAHLSAIKGSLPFLHFFDGFRTSHEINTIEDLTKEDVMRLIDKDALKSFKNRALHPNNKHVYGMAQNEDVYFQIMESRNIFYDKIPDIVNEYMKKINDIMHTNYKPFVYYGKKDAKKIIVAMGSVNDTIKEVVDNLEDVGLIEVHLYRPFSEKYFLDVLPKTVEKVAVLDKTKEAGSFGEPLFLDVASVLRNHNIKVYGGRYGLSSRNTSPSDIYSVFKMLDENPKHNFTVGINDDVTNLSIKKYNFNVDNNSNEIKVFGFGSDGMVSASKDLLKVINKVTDNYVEGYFEYDSKKSGGVTISHLRYSSESINKPYYVTNPKLIVVTKDVYFRLFDIVNDIKDNGILLINTIKNEEELNKLIPSKVKKILKEKNIKVYYIDADNIAYKHNLKGKISKIMESLILQLLNFECLDVLKDNIKFLYKTKGEEVINSNINSLDEAYGNLNKLNIDYEPKDSLEIIDTDVISLVNARKGYEIPVSKLMPFANGAFPWGTTKNEKRNISNIVPVWNKDNCIQCGMCSLVCPHAVIRSVISNDGINLIKSNDLKYSIKISEKDCTGCGLCVNVCPGKMGNKALELIEKPIKNEIDFDKYNYENPLQCNSVKGTQLQKPLFSFSGACAGCGETSYIKLLTQMFQEELIIANATGCSSIYGGSFPSSPYEIPWANSLFEDNAEFALGIHMTFKHKRKEIENIMRKYYKSVSDDVRELFDIWLNNKENYQINKKIKHTLLNKSIPQELKELSDYIIARAIWAIGGDGWAYDIGYGGLDHVLHSNENVKILVLDTEVYSNTGGQASKASKYGAVAEFANSGKRTVKKDLFRLAMSIPNCYVASVAIGANMNQTIKAFNEANKHEGPAIIIAYAPCIEQGIKSGMASSIDEQKLAVSCGYTLLMRYDNNLVIDSKEPEFDMYNDFLNNEIRYNALKIKDENLAKELLSYQKENAVKRYNYYKKISEINPET